MCGIAGLRARPGGAPPSLDALKRMVAVLSHRGPDGYGLYRDPQVGFGHARLSLIDLEGAAQPLRNGDGTVWLCFNGEVFNYLELRQHLLDLGHKFYTDGDGEVIVQAYERYGAQAWSMLNGQFAFALWDSRSRNLWLVRDRLGILPLYYAWRPDGSLAFASEVKALYADGVMPQRFSARGLAEAFSCWSTAAPHTVFEGVRQVRPGAALRIHPEGTESEKVFWQPSGAVSDCRSLDDAVDGLEHLLSQAVNIRLRADVPVGAYISGGLDSSVLGSLAVEQSAGPVETFGIGFADPRFDETPEQERMVRHLGTHHHGTLVGGGAIRDALEDVVWHLEMPSLRTSPVPLFLLSRLVRDNGIRTVLTGEGADELLAGYTIFKEDQIRRFWARRPESRIRPALLARIHHYVGGDQARSSGLWQSFFSRDLERTDHPFYSHLIRWQNTAGTLRLLSPDIRAGFSLDAMMTDAEAEMPAGWRDWDPLLRAQVIEIRSFMSSYLLSCQGDRVTMAHGIEARYPYLDPAVVDYCLALPKRFKLRGMNDKIALRKLAARRLPDVISGRRKQPFRAPIGQALFGPEAKGRFDHALSAAALTETGLVDVPIARQLIDKAHRQGGRMASEREEMGLTGILTLSLLSHQFGPGFAERVREAERRLATIPLHFFRDELAEAATPSALS